MARYRKRPSSVDAVQWQALGDHPRVSRYVGLAGSYAGSAGVPAWQCQACLAPREAHGWVNDAEGGLRVCPGDWIVTDESQDLVVLPDALFQKIYEPVEG